MYVYTPNRRCDTATSVQIDDGSTIVRANTGKDIANRR